MPEVNSKYIPKLQIRQQDKCFDDENVVLALFIFCIWHSTWRIYKGIQHGGFIRARMRKSGDMIRDQVRILYLLFLWSEGSGKLQRKLQNFCLTSSLHILCQKNHPRANGAERRSERKPGARVLIPHG
jgi:hypothetical protein